MRYLLDTCALIWLVNGGTELGPGSRAICSDSANVLFISAVSAWEIAIKHARGKLTLKSPPVVWFKKAMASHDLTEVPITAEIAIASAALPSLHTDPMDRLLVATAQKDGLILLTPDRLISQYGNVKTLW